MGGCRTKHSSKLLFKRTECSSNYWFEFEAVISFAVYVHALAVYVDELLQYKWLTIFENCQIQLFPRHVCA